MLLGARSALAAWASVAADEPTWSIFRRSGSGSSLKNAANQEESRFHVSGISSERYPRHHTVSPDTIDIERLLPGLLGAVVGAADDLWCCDAVHRTPGQRTPSYRPRTREEDVMRAPDHHFQ